MNVENTISIEEARLVVRKLASQTFIDDEEAIFIAFLEREGLLIGWVEKLKSCFDVDQFEVDLKGSNVFQNVAKQVVRQFESAQPERRKIECSEQEAELLVNFTCAMLQDFIREHVDRFEGIIRGIKVELRGLIITRRIAKWEDVCQILSLDELERFEEDLRGQRGGEAVVLPDDDPASSSTTSKKEGRIVWRAKTDNLHWVAEHLETELKWISDRHAWVQFFDPGKEPIAKVICKNVHQVNIALLIQLLREADKLTVIVAKGFWGKVKRLFQGETQKPWNQSWAKVANAARNDDGIFRNFIRDTKPLREHLGIHDEDISDFLGRMRERLEDN